MAQKVEITDSRLWFWPSPVESPNNPVTDCVTLSHGATYGYFSDGYFAVPNNTTIHFYVAPGIPFNNGPGAITEVVTRNRHMRTDGSRNPALAALDVGPGRHCPNYELSKVLNDAAHGAPDDYEGLSGIIDSAQAGVKAAGGYNRPDQRPGIGAGDIRWCPHVVTVRKRWYAKTIDLRTLIEVTQRHKPHITDFYVVACRVHRTAGQYGWDKANAWFAPKPY
ncbi:putative adhesin [Polyangium sorediatum]|uniref:Putative adhesin Stv domain-containing protein n=1 Tax=Polyangium sorediatum TaxID=889274 RepID=A0ABT6P8E1_9BACT|nr:hypothetical protein [Polyangium sorediatum]MDI1436852.1 hypothetical protein [Polyangium sorediatum]